jgi:lipoprotein-anchoring transpeptidase ErfK/SrfK
LQGFCGKPSSGLEPETPLLTMRCTQQAGAAMATDFACLRGLCAPSICRCLPPVATTGLHKGSILSRPATVSARTSWHIVVDTSSRRVTVYDHSRRVWIFKAIVGAASTPTPPGRFFVEESIKLPAGAVGAPFALALSARSNVLQEFAGGPGQIALHGLRNVGGTLGTAVSHGCERLDTGAMRWLVTRIGPGVPVTITR